jgi:hypothetical protein
VAEGRTRKRHPGNFCSSRQGPCWRAPSSAGCTSLPFWAIYVHRCGGSVHLESVRSSSTRSAD